MAKTIRYRGKASEDNQMLKLILPHFVLCLRDFGLKMQKNGKDLSENEYLEDCLAENNSRTEDFNKPREYIRTYFPKRECFAFPVPGDGNVIENLENIEFTDLSEKFKGTASRFVSYIHSAARM